MSFSQSGSEFDLGALAPISESDMEATKAEIQATTKKAQTMAVFNESASKEIHEIAEASPVPAITLNGRPMVEGIVDSVNGGNDLWYKVKYVGDDYLYWKTAACLEDSLLVQAYHRHNPERPGGHAKV
jgi:hypothetical protein